MPHASTVDEVEALLDELMQNSQQSDVRFAESRSRVLARKYGSNRIEHDLRVKGLADEVIDVAVIEARRSDFFRAREAWSKRFGAKPANSLEKARQIRFLQSRGFSFDIIRAVIADTDEV